MQYSVYSMYDELGNDFCCQEACDRLKGESTPGGDLPGEKYRSPAQEDSAVTNLGLH